MYNDLFGVCMCCVCVPMCLQSSEVLEDRRLRLQEFLRTVIRTCSQPATINGKQRPAYITHSTTKSKFVKILPFLA